MNAQARGHRGQISLELGFAMIAAFMLIMGSVVLFGWVNSRLVYRQEAFEKGASSGRAVAGRTWNENQVDETAMPQLDIFDW